MTRFIGGICVLTLLAAGCSQSLFMQGRQYAEQGRHQDAIQSFYAEISSHPKKYEAWRELGRAFYQTDDLDKAEEAFKEANRIQPDPVTFLYLGMISEKREQLPEAIQSYTQSLGLRSHGEAADLARTRREALVQKQIQLDARNTVSTEKSIDVAAIPEHTIAVTDFDAVKMPEDLAPLSKGMAELVTSDLSKVSQLTVVERRRLDAIMQELDLGKSVYADRSSAPRVGKLMGSRRMVTGALLSEGNQALSVEGVVVNTVDSSMRYTSTVGGALDKFFSTEKQFVFEVLKELGIEPTPQERDEISKVPTESYLAFLAYSRGLDFESRGMLEEAGHQYQEAVRIDPGFGLAERRLAVADALLTTASGGANLTQLQEAADAQAGRGGADNQLGARLAEMAAGTETASASGSNGNTTAEVVPAGAGTGTVVITGTIDE